MLTVTTVDRDGLNPIPNVRIELWPDDPDHDGITYVNGHVGTFEEAPLTDEAGKAVFHLPPGVDARIDAEGNADQVGEARVSLTALAPGETREIRIELSVGYDLRLCGQVVAAVGGSPIQGAVVRFQSESSTVVFGGTWDDEFQTHVEISTDSDGRFEVQLPSWEDWMGRVDSPGLGPGVFRPTSGYEDPDRALRIELKKGAVLRGTVSAAINVEGHSVRVEVNSRQIEVEPRSPHGSLGDPSWTVKVARNGSWQLRDLPPEAELQIELRSPNNERIRQVSDLVLEPGEERVFDWRLGSGATVGGRVVLASNGEALADQTIWLVLEGGYYSAGFFETYWEPTAVTQTDDHGAFEFDDVAPGRWLVGPAPEEESDDRSVAPLAEIVEVLVGSQDISLLLEVHRGLYIRGKVTDPYGEAAREPNVVGWSLDTEWWTSTRGEDDGTFVLGPLTTGEYTLLAMGREHAQSNPVAARAGADGIVLRLNPGGRISGMVVDAASGKPRAAELSVCSMDDGGTWWGGYSRDDGTFQFEELSTGRYGIKASTGDHVGLVGDIFVAAGAEVKGIIVSLEPGASLTLRHSGEDARIWFFVIVDGVTIEDGELDARDRQKLVLPAGETTVKFVQWHDEETTTVTEQTVVLAVGEKAEVVWPEPDEDK